MEVSSDSDTDNSDTSASEDEDYDIGDDCDANGAKATTTEEEEELTEDDFTSLSAADANVGLVAVNIRKGSRCATKRATGVMISQTLSDVYLLSAAHTGTSKKGTHKHVILAALKKHPDLSHEEALRNCASLS